MSETWAVNERSSIAIVGMAGRFPGAADVDELWENLRGGVESVVFFSDEELAAAGVDRATLASRTTCGRAPSSTGSSSSTRPCSASPRARPRCSTRSSGSSWSALGGAGARGVRLPASTRGRSASSAASTSAAISGILYSQPRAHPCLRRLPHPARQRQGLPGHPGLLQAEPARARASRCRPPARRRWWRSTWPARACSTASATWRWPAASRSSCRSAPATSTSARRHLLARRPLPRLRRRRAGHRVGSGVGRRRPQAAGGRAGRRRHDPRGDPGLGRSTTTARARSATPRPSVEGQAEVIAEALARGRRRARDDRLRRGPRHRHAAGRSDRGRRADPGVPRAAPSGDGFCAIGSVKTNIGHLDAAAGDRRA